MPKDQKTSVAHMVSLCAVFMAFTLLFLYLAVVFPTSKIAMYFMSSIFVAGILVENRPGSALLTFVGSSILGLLIVPNKIMLLPYVLLLGHYGIGKFYIEKMNNRLLSYLVKLIYFNVCAAVIYVLFAYIFVDPSILGVQLWMAILSTEIAFVVYDFVYSKLTLYYATMIRPLIL